MRVGLLTSWDERCGIAEYAKNLVRHVSADFKILGREPRSLDVLLSDLQDCKLLHVNYEPGLFHWLSPDLVCAIKDHGIKTIMTYHTSSKGDNKTPLTLRFDCVVVHESTTDGFDQIPQGILEVSGLPDVVVPVRIGSAGFPFPWKGFQNVAKASKLLGFGCLIVAPASHHYDTSALEQSVLRDQPECEYVKDWLPEEDVIKKLATCTVNVFAYDGSCNGISGAVRLGIAAKRPLVLTRNRQFRDLFDYEDEIEFIDCGTADAIVGGVQRVLASNKKPKRVLDAMSWSIVAQQYGQLYSRLSE